MVPGSPPLPEYMKASVYLPPSLVDHHPEIRPSILQITQQFLETIGVTTVRNWKVRAQKDLGYSLKTTNVARPNGTIYDVPQPQFRSSHYIIPGQPMKTSLDDRLTLTVPPNTWTAPGVSSSTSLSSPLSSSSYGSEDNETVFVQRFNTQEQVDILTEQLSSAQREIQRLEGQLELFSGLDDGPGVPTPTRNTPRYDICICGPPDLPGAISVPIKVQASYSPKGTCCRRSGPSLHSSPRVHTIC